MHETEWLLNDWVELIGQIVVIVIFVLLLPKLVEKTMVQTRKRSGTGRNPGKRSRTKPII